MTTDGGGKPQDSLLPGGTSPVRGGPGGPLGPYHVEQVGGDDGGPRWRLAGPGLGETKAYPWAEVRDKLDELAALMNFAWARGRDEPS
jgi:hypothetical protein